MDSLRTAKKFKKTEIGEIPVDWEILPLCEISEEVYRYPTYYNIEYVEQGVPEVRGELIKSDGTLEQDLTKYRYISVETSAKFPRTRLREGDLVMSVRGTMGKVAIIPKSLDGANMTANLIRISPDRGRIFPPFLHQMMISDRFQNLLDITSSSTTIKTIKAPELKHMKFAIPPLLEQKKVAEILSTVDKRIEKSNEVIEKTKELKKGLMQELLTHGIGHKKFKKTKLGEIPMEWEIKRLRDVGVLKGGSGFPEKYQGHTDKKYPFLKVSDMNLPENKIHIQRSTNTIDEQISKIIGSTIFPKDTIIFAKVGAALLLNRRRILTTDSCIDNNMMGLIVSAKNHLKFYYYVMLTIDFGRYVFTGALPSVNQTILGDIDVVRPPFLEQRRIAEILSSVDEEIEQETAHNEELKRIKKGLMQVFLTGKVRVKV